MDGWMDGWVEVLDSWLLCCFLVPTSQCARHTSPAPHTHPPHTHTQTNTQPQTLLIAGHETTAAVLTWTLHLLADRPDVVARIRQEVGGGGG